MAVSVLNGSVSAVSAWLFLSLMIGVCVLSLLSFYNHAAEDRK